MEKDTETTYEEPHEFLKQGIPRELKHIHMNLYSKYKKINLWIFMSTYSNSQYSVEGNDPTWVKGTSAHFSDVFNKHKISHDFFHSNKRWLVYFAVGIVLAIFIWPGTKGEGLAGMLLPIAYVFVFPTYFNFILGWLFPRNEIENSERSKYRRAVYSVISVIVLGLILLAMEYWITNK